MNDPINYVEVHVDGNSGSSQNKNESIKERNVINEEKVTQTMQPCENETVHSETPNGDANVYGDSPLNEDNGDYSKIEEDNFEVIPEYDPSYPPMVKWTKDHPKTQIIGNPTTSVLTTA